MATTDPPGSRDDDDTLLPGPGPARAPAGTPSPTPTPPGAPVTATDALLHRLAEAPQLDTNRYERRGEVARGGVGAIHRLRDRYLNRDLAMKTLLARGAPADDDERRLSRQLLGRFLEEAQVTSQLDHPGVVPVHELGRDERGEFYFTMRLVQGRTASDVFADARANENDWNLTRALEVILKVCDTVAYAHDKGVLHRDLKPSNVMVGAFGEVYVMDWGLAKVTGGDTPFGRTATPDDARGDARDDARDDAPGDARRDARVRARDDAHAARTSPAPIESVRHQDAESADGSTMVSLHGQRLGTPSYMPPEQARGEEVDARADVYAIGAMLYELLVGRPPYVVPGERRGPWHVLAAVVAGPPERIEAARHDVPAELVAIADQAMARAPADRYANASAFAADLRAFLAQRAVAAYRTGPIVELLLWVRRNRSLATAIGAAALILVAAVIVATTLANRNATLVVAEAKAKEGFATKVAEFDQLSGVVWHDRAVASATKLYPAWPHNVEAMERWLRDDAGRLLTMQPVLAQTVAAIAPRIAADESQRFLHDTLTALLRRLETFAAKVKPGVQQRLDWARHVQELSLRHPEARHGWVEVRAAIAGSPAYAGRTLELRDEDVLGLVPIGENPVTKLWEFYELRSAWDGTSDASALPIPQHEANGSIVVGDDTGIVFVLLPGGTVTVGAQTSDPAAPFHDPENARANPLRRVELAPFFVARHELTQGQWQRLWTWDETRRSPSGYPAGAELAGKSRVTLAHPVEQVDSGMCAQLLSRHGMVLPTEAQWEYACRAGTTTPWIVEHSRLREVANLADATAKETISAWVCESWHDGHIAHAPVGSFAANAFGLHDVHGNVWEWCRESYGPTGGERAGDGQRPEGDRTSGCIRGGSHSFPGTGARSAFRSRVSHTLWSNGVGLRAARALQPRD